MNLFEIVKKIRELGYPVFNIQVLSAESKNDAILILYQVFLFLKSATIIQYTIKGRFMSR